MLPWNDSPVRLATGQAMVEKPENAKRGSLRCSTSEPTPFSIDQPLRTPRRYMHTKFYALIPKLQNTEVRYEASRLADP